MNHCVDKITVKVVRLQVKMRAIVTGATGFVGQWLVRELCANNYDVTVIVRDLKKVPDQWKNGIEIVYSAMENYKDIQKTDFLHDSYDIFFHFAWAGTSGQSRSDYDLQLKNVYAACEVLKLAKRLSCRRFVNAGSLMEYDVMEYLPRDGVEPTAGYIYGIAKLTADFMLKTLAVQEGMEYVNVIISNIYGVGEKSARFLNQLLRKLMSDQRIALTSGVQLYDFIYVTDAVKGIICAAQKGENNSVYYIGNRKPQPLKNYILQAKEILKSNAELAFGEVPFNGVMLTYQEFDTEKLFDMGFEIEVPFEKGILMTSEWIKRENLAYVF